MAMSCWQWFVKVWFVWFVWVLAWQLKAVDGHFLDCYPSLSTPLFPWNWHNGSNADVANLDKRNNQLRRPLPGLPVHLPNKNYQSDRRQVLFVFCVFIFILPALPTLANVLYAPSIDYLVIKQVYENLPNVRNIWGISNIRNIWGILEDIL